jgi:hypothetical protein
MDPVLYGVEVFVEVVYTFRPTPRKDGASMEPSVAAASAAPSVGSISSASTLNRGLRIFFSEFVRVSLSRPSQALFFARTVLWQGRAARLRARHAAEDLAVPHIAIFSITNGCS